MCLAEYAKKYIRNWILEHNVHEIAMQPINPDTDHMQHHEALDVHRTVDGGAQLLFKTNYVIINTI